ncbi:MAG TPA: CPBP family intramembrane glutamic endopeptidase [Puia sp.]|nr:CPBP family intramembrane glutamic endopeptidase [Puia sp.]
MNENINSKPLISQGWLRVLLFCVAYFAIILLIATPIILLVKSSVDDPKTDITALMNGDYLWVTILLTALVLFILVFIFRKFIDRQTFASLGFELDGFFADAASGFFIAPAILGIGTIILYFSGHLLWLDVNADFSKLFIAFGMVVIIAFSEELVFRGYILNNLMQSFNKWIALFISAILFAAAHSLNPGINLLSVGGLFLAGILLGINYIYTKNLWFAILFHLSWNFFQGPILGYKVSGVSVPTLLEQELKGDTVITGGDFGFEASMINILLLLIAISVLYFIYEKKYKTPAAAMA